MYLTGNLSGSFAVAPSGITGTKSSSINTGKCLATAQTLGGEANALMLSTLPAGQTATPANTNEQLVRSFING